MATVTFGGKAYNIGSALALYWDTGSSLQKVPPTYTWNVTGNLALTNKPAAFAGANQYLIYRILIHANSTLVYEGAMDLSSAAAILSFGWKNNMQGDVSLFYAQNYLDVNNVLTEVVSPVYTGTFTPAVAVPVPPNAAAPTITTTFS